MHWIDASRAQFRFIPRWNSVYEAVSVEIKIRPVYCGSQQNTEALSHRSRMPLPTSSEPDVVGRSTLLIDLIQELFHR